MDGGDPFTLRSLRGNRRELEALVGGYCRGVFGCARDLADLGPVVGILLAPLGPAVAHHRSRGWGCVGAGGAGLGPPATETSAWAAAFGMMGRIEDNGGCNCLDNYS